MEIILGTEWAHLGHIALFSLFWEIKYDHFYIKYCDFLTRILAAL